MNPATPQTFRVFLADGRQATVAVRAETRGCSFRWSLVERDRALPELGGGAGCKDAARALFSALSQMAESLGEAVAVLPSVRETPPRIRVLA